ncbi:hypothetical protein ABBQ38_014383 [Trebouxia sp. C0009 RCD-2024]
MFSSRRGSQAPSCSQVIWKQPLRSATLRLSCIKTRVAWSTNAARSARGCQPAYAQASAGGQEGKQGPVVLDGHPSRHGPVLSARSWGSVFRAASVNVEAASQDEMSRLIALMELQGDASFLGFRRRGGPQVLPCICTHPPYRLGSVHQGAAAALVLHAGVQPNFSSLDSSIRNRGTVLNWLASLPGAQHQSSKAGQGTQAEQLAP